MVIFGTLISSSSGNASIISDGKTTILTDCGMSGKKFEESLKSIDMLPNDISAVLVTHEHSDHIQGVGIISKRFGLNVYASEGTLTALSSCCKLSDDKMHIINAGCDFQIGSIGICPFSIPHDATQPLGFSYFAESRKFSLATDIGIMTDDIKDNLIGSETVILESNHDIEMLKFGPYPYSLKKRILGDHGKNQKRYTQKY